MNKFNLTQLSTTLAFTLKVSKTCVDDRDGLLDISKNSTFKKTSLEFLLMKRNAE